MLSTRSIIYQLFFFYYYYLLIANDQTCFAVRALWFVLEIIMAKNENNSHAFIRKMVENIKQTKDAQAPTDPKTNEVSGARGSFPPDGEG